MWIRQHRTCAFLHTFTKIRNASLIAGLYAMHVFATLQAVVLSSRKAIWRLPEISPFSSRSNTAAADASSSSGLIEMCPDWISFRVILAHTPHSILPNACAPQPSWKNADESDDTSRAPACANSDLHNSVYQRSLLPLNGKCCHICGHFSLYNGFVPRSSQVLSYCEFCVLWV